MELSNKVRYVKCDENVLKFKQAISQLKELITIEYGPSAATYFYADIIRDIEDAFYSKCETL